MKVGSDEATDETTAQQEGAGQNPARFAVDALQGGRAKNALIKPRRSRTVEQSTLSSSLRILAVADGDTPSGPLAGLRVLDLTRLLPGPMATLHLADQGAEVIKIEDTGLGDYARTMGPGAAQASAEGKDSPFFRMLNRNKKSLRLDLKQPAGVQVFLRLAAEADVIFESFRPGVVDRLGIGYEAVRAINPRIVYCAITGYGQTGPWAHYAGHDINFIAMSGLLDQIGTPGSAPAMPDFQIGDLLGGCLTSLVGVLTAVMGAKATGRGSHVDVAMADAILAHSVFPLLATQTPDGLAPRGEGEMTGASPGYAVYPTADDRYLAVGAIESKFWQTLCTALGLPELATTDMTNAAEMKHAREALAMVIKTQPLAYWKKTLVPLDCCVTPVLRLDEAVNHPQFIARQIIVNETGLTQCAPPFKLSHWPQTERRPAATAGADSAAVLQAVGYSADEIETLRRDGVI
ncbi:CaiB/BaiF CoA transferase family protein [Rugosibacter aromaticivorans]|uniref:CaiB/BaiF CoA transferase family protein n=1 Tax=Rugosibacter aromaticivorans TaxID=1565605 RepID=UPI000A8B9AFC|nr:CaiB/BaiF CoA-transferase family protein [Rugosibacter aromaticivorans]